MADENEAELVLQLKLSTESGTDAERDAIRAAEDRIEAIFQEHNLGIIDGDEFGNGVCLIFCFGTNADAMFDALTELIAASPLFRGGKATKLHNLESEVSEVML